MKAVLVLLLLVCAVRSQYEPDCFCLEELLAANGLISPTDLRAPPDGSGRLMISEQPGTIYVFNADGSRVATPFVNMTDAVSSVHGEDGLLSFVFHPDYATNGRLYMRYSPEQTGQISRLSEFLVDSTDPNQMDRTSERVLFDTYEEYTGHNGGGLLFGVDGYLYVTTGDGGYQLPVGDEANHAQNKSNNLGKVLRIDVDTRTGDLEYGIPPDNPYLADPQAIPELYALGLRNPWRAGMDPGDRSTGAGAGRIFMGDVGQHTWEEVDLLVAGGNYAWSGKEGPQCYKPDLCNNTEPEVAPLAYYNRTAIGGAAVIAGHMYRGCMNPNYNGWFFFADFTNKHMFRLLETSPDVWDFKEIFPCSTCPSGLTNVYNTYVQFFGLDEQGELYLGTQDIYDNTLPEGAVYKFVDPSNTQPPCPA